jgi:flagellar biosynthesis chaperone FliJ
MLVSGATAQAQGVAPAPGRNRPALEQQFRERTAKLAQQKLGLTDAQLGRLEQSNARFAPQLRQVAAQEREIRVQLRQEMTAGNSANQQHVSDLLDGALRLQKQRISIIESEQKDLATFLTPVQRARYLALQSQFMKRAQELSGEGGRKNQGPGGQRRRPPFGRMP